MLGAANEPTAQCDVCNSVARQLFHVQAQRRETQLYEWQAGTRASVVGSGTAPARLPPARAHAKGQGGVRDDAHTAWTHVCIACAAPVMAEARGLVGGGDASIGDPTTAHHGFGS